MKNENIKSVPMLVILSVVTCGKTKILNQSQC